jgi:hypothetical protein
MCGCHPLNTSVFHNHIALCSTSFVGGSRYHSCKESYRAIKRTSDAYCKVYGLSVIEKPSLRRSRSYAEAKAEREGKPTWKTVIKEDVDAAITQASSFKMSIANLRGLGYEVKRGGNISVRPPGKERFFRLTRNLGAAYAYEPIRSRVYYNYKPRQPISQARADISKPKPLPKCARGSFVALYRHYLYLFGYYQQKCLGSGNARMHYLLREDIRKLGEYIDCARLLGRECIETSTQLQAFWHRIQRTVEDLSDERKLLYRVVAKAESPAAVSDARERIAAINQRLKKHRKELRLCNVIADRSHVILEKIEAIQSEPVVAGKDKIASRDRGFER